MIIRSSLAKVEATGNILASMQLDELSSLQELAVHFDNLDDCDQFSPQPFPDTLIATGTAWKEVGIACAARNITLLVWHLESAL